MARSRSVSGEIVQESGSGAHRYPQIFLRQDGSSVKFYILTHQDERQISRVQLPLNAEHARALRRQITRHGGELVGEISDEPDTLIVNEDAVDDYRHYYYFNRTTYPEHPGFVASCIQDGRYQHIVPAPQPMGGRPSGYRRVNFIDEDEINMCEFLAYAAPDPSAGGRSGPGIWRKLMTCKTNPGCAWINRHTAYSWQEHYKKNKHRLDPLIAEMVAKDPPPAGRKGLYHLSRKQNGRPAARKEKGKEIQERSDEEVEVDASVLERDEVEELVTPGRERKSRSMSNTASPAEQARQSRRRKDPNVLFTRQAHAPPPSPDSNDDPFEIPSDFENEEEPFVRSTPSLNVRDVSASPASRSPAPSPPSTIARQQEHRIDRSLPLFSLPRLTNRQPNSTVPISSQMTLVDPLATQPRFNDTAASPQRRTPKRDVMSAEPPTHNRPKASESERTQQGSTTASISGPAKKRRKTQPEVAVPHIEDLIKRQRNVASSGALSLDRRQARRRGEDAWLRENHADVEQEPAERAGRYRTSGSAPNDEKPEVEQIRNAASDEEGSAIGGARNSRTPPRLTRRASEQQDEAVGLYPDLDDDARSSDDERTHHKLTSSQHALRASRERRAQADAPEPSPSRSARQSGRQDFSASEDEDEDEDEDENMVKVEDMDEDEDEDMDEDEGEDGDMDEDEGEDGDMDEDEDEDEDEDMDENKDEDEDMDENEDEDEDDAFPAPVRAGLVASVPEKTQTTRTTRSMLRAARMSVDIQAVSERHAPGDFPPVAEVRTVVQASAGDGAVAAPRARALSKPWTRAQARARAEQG